MLEPLLEIADSSMTYRRRYFARPQLRAGPATCCSLDDTNTRAVAFQLAAVSEHIRHLPRDPKAPSPTREERLIDQAVATLRQVDPQRGPSSRGPTDARAADGAARLDRGRSAGLVGDDHLLLLQSRGAPCQLTPAPVQYEVVHTTEYDYSESVAVSHHLARLSPRALPHQECLHHDLQIEPAPAVMTTHTDYFGNAVTFFAMQGAHKRLTVRARSRWRCRPRACRRRRTRHRGRRSPTARRCRSRRWSFCSTRRSSPASAELAAYARASFPPGRPLLDAVLELTRRIHEEFTFDPKATTDRDAAGGRLRVAARRVSGLRTARDRVPALARAAGAVRQRLSRDRPAPGPPRLLGADASHAWLAVYCPGRRLDSRRPHQQPAAIRHARHPGLGARLQRRQPDPRRDPRRRRPYASTCTSTSCGSPDGEASVDNDQRSTARDHCAIPARS